MMVDIKKKVYVYRKAIYISTTVFIVFMGFYIYFIVKPYYIKLRDLDSSMKEYKMNGKAIKTEKLAKEFKNNREISGGKTLSSIEVNQLHTLEKWHTYTKNQITLAIYNVCMDNKLSVRDISYENKGNTVQYTYHVIGSYSNLYHFIYDIEHDLPYLVIKEILFTKVELGGGDVNLVGAYTDVRKQ